MAPGVEDCPIVFTAAADPLDGSYSVNNKGKWGGVLIVVGALLPLPFSIASMAPGLINYNFGHYLLFGLSRFPRYVIYAIPIFLIF